MLGVFFVYILLKYMLAILLPFMISFVIVCSLKKTVGRISEKTKIPSPVIIFLLSVAVLAVIGVFIIVIVEGLQAVMEMVAKELSRENNIFEMLIIKIRELENKIPLLKKLDNTNGGIVSIFAEIVGDLVKKCSVEITRLVADLPKFLFTTFVTVMSLFYFTKDYERLKGYARTYLPKKVYDVSVFLKNNVIKILSKYVKSYFLLFFMTFAELLSGFLILGIGSPMALALIIGALDMLPVLGSSMILIVWAVMMLFCGNTKLGVGLIVLAVIIYIVRQVTEPRLISAQMNTHPITTLFFMYAGFKLSGIIGMLLAPIIPFLLKPVFEVLKKSKNTVDNKNKL